MCLIDAIVDFLQKNKDNPFERIIDDFAQLSGVKVWDWIAIIIAIIALYIAYKTLQSQRKTQENTKSLVKPWEAITTFLRDCVIPLTRIETFIYCFDKYSGKKIHSIKYCESLFTGLYVPMDNTEIFYDDQSTYSSVSNFKNSINTLNERMESFIIEIKDPAVSEELYESLLHEVNYALSNAYYYWYTLFINVITYQLYQKRKKNYAYSFIDGIIKLISKKSYTNFYANDAQSCFENIILARFESFEYINSRGLKNTVNVFVDDTITSEIVSSFTEYGFSKSIYRPIRNKNDYWSFFLMYLLTEENVENIAYYLNLHLSAMETRFQELMINSKGKRSGTKKNKSK